MFLVLRTNQVKVKLNQIEFFFGTVYDYSSLISGIRVSTCSPIRNSKRNKFKTLPVLNGSVRTFHEHHTRPLQTVLLGHHVLQRRNVTMFRATIPLVVSFILLMFFFVLHSNGPNTSRPKKKAHQPLERRRLVNAPGLPMKTCATPLYYPHLCTVFRAGVSDPEGCALTWILPKVIVVYFLSKRHDLWVSGF